MLDVFLRDLSRSVSFSFFLYPSLPLLPPEAREAPVGELGVQVKECLEKMVL
jgi:hypothetical protein